MNLISKTHHSCERRKYAFMVLREYTIISLNYNIGFLWSLISPRINQLLVFMYNFLKPHFFSSFFTKYKYILAYFQQELFSKKVDKLFPNEHLGCVYHQLKKLVFFTIQLIFAVIHGPIALFNTIYGLHCTILVTFQFYLQYFQQKVFNFS